VRNSAQTGSTLADEQIGQSTLCNRGQVQTNCAGQGPNAQYLLFAALALSLLLALPLLQLIKNPDRPHMIQLID
jgi:hypothetical protein